MYPSATKEERYADGVVHIAGLVAVAAGGGALLLRAGAMDSPYLVAACIIYLLCVAFSCAVSAAYHQLPLPNSRLLMRRLDHAAIYAVIAATFTPLLLIAGTIAAHWILAAIWIFAAAGIVFKMAGSDLDARWSLASYIAMGWFGVFALPSFFEVLPQDAMIAIGAGAVFYTVGTLFYRNKAQRYRYSIWHALGLAGAMSFFTAIWISVTA